MNSIKHNLTLFIRQVMYKVDFLAFYPCTIVAQNTDGTLELKADSPEIGSFSGIPIRYGLPGVAVQLTGGRCLIGWEGGSPKHPIACLFEASGVSAVYLGTAQPTGGDVTDYVALASKVEAALVELKTAINNATPMLLATGIDNGAALKTSLMVALKYWPPDMGATKVKAQ